MRPLSKTYTARNRTYIGIGGTTYWGQTDDHITPMPAQFEIVCWVLSHKKNILRGGAFRHKIFNIFNCGLCISLSSDADILQLYRMLPYIHSLLLIWNDFCQSELFSRHLEFWKRLSFLKVSLEEFFNDMERFWIFYVFFYKRVHTIFFFLLYIVNWINLRH